MTVVMTVAGPDDEPLRGDLKHRACVIAQVPGKPFVVQVDDADAARQLADVLASFQLYQLDECAMPDYSNAVWTDSWDGEEWESDDD